MSHHSALAAVTSGYALKQHLTILGSFSEAFASTLSRLLLPLGRPKAAVFAFLHKLGSRLHVTCQGIIHLRSLLKKLLKLTFEVGNHKRVSIILRDKGLDKLMIELRLHLIGVRDKGSLHMAILMMRSSFMGIHIFRHMNIVHFGFLTAAAGLKLIEKSASQQTKSFDHWLILEFSTMLQQDAFLVVGTQRWLPQKDLCLDFF